MTTYGYWLGKRQSEFGIKGTIFSYQKTHPHQHLFFTSLQPTNTSQAFQPTQDHHLIMLYSTIVLTLATAATAIDIRFFGESHCRNGIGYSCRNMNANSCCGGQRSNGWAAMSFAAIPTNWDVYTRAYTGENCYDGNLKNQFRSEGRSDLCHGDNLHYESGKYYFASKKAIRGMTIEERDEPQECVKPDTLYFPDDSTYAISSLTDAQVEELVCYSPLCCNVDITDLWF
jgi:hypothetical protein